MASQAFDRALYGSHPYAHPDIGYAQTVSGIRLEQLESFHTNHYGPNGLVMAVCGGIEPDVAREIFSRTLAPGKTTPNPLLRRSRLSRRLQAPFAAM